MSYFRPKTKTAFLFLLKKRMKIERVQIFSRKRKKTKLTKRSNHTKVSKFIIKSKMHKVERLYTA